MVNLNVSNIDVQEKQVYIYQNYIIYIIFIYTFLYSNVIKLILTDFLHINLLYPILPLVLILLFYLFYKNNVNYLVVYLVVSIVSLNLISIIEYNIGLSHYYRFLNAILIPLLLVGFRIQENSIKSLWKNILWVFNLVIILNVIYGIIDYLTGKKMQFILADMLSFTHYSNSIGNDVKSEVYRLFSLLGHPLTNMLLLVIFISMNLAYSHYFKEKANLPNYLVIIITIIGTFLCNSKFGILIISILLLSTILVGKKKAKMLMFIIVSFLIIFASGSLLDNVMKRFMIASERGDISNGRFSAVESLIQFNGIYPNYFTGRGLGYSDELLQSISSLNNIEMPLLMYMYDYGIFVTILIYFLIYIIPSFIFIKNSHIYLLFLYSMIFLFANSYNGMATSIGILQIVAFVSMMMVNLSYLLRKLTVKGND